MIDCLFISPDSSKESYQGLADRYTAIEPQPWLHLLAGALRNEYDVACLDPLAEGMSDADAWEVIAACDPRYICFVIYGQNPNSGTTNMAGAVRLSKYIRSQTHHIPIVFIGSHPSALPYETLKLTHTGQEDYVCDYVCPGDGLNALRSILRGEVNYRYVVWGKAASPEELKYAWDLLPDLGKYRCHTWHCNFDESKRSPFAAIYTSLGCTFKCDFCMINLVNRTSEEQRDASESSGMRYFNPDYVLSQLQYLAGQGVRNVRLSDEMFFLNRNHYLPIVNGLVTRGLDLNLWAYARVDTVRPNYLPLFKKAGINWLCLGIESGNQRVRREASKGSYEDVDVRQVAQEIKDAGINLLANFMFGLPEDTPESMEETLQLALELNAEHTNFYPCMALPGSPIYRNASAQGIELPQPYSAFSFHSYDCQPLATKHCSAADVLRFRDRAWERCSLDPAHLALVDEKFGTSRQIVEQAKVKLKRKLLEA